MRPEIQLAVPSSFASETADQKIKTYKVGLIARAAAVFNVNRIAVYRDAKQVASDDGSFISLILRYMETPQYLRKLLFPRVRDLRYIGVVPPLKTPHHVLTNGDIRDGIVTDVGTDRAWVEIGLDCPALLRTTKVRKGERVTVRIFSRDQLEVEAIQKPSAHWGYSVRMADSIEDVLEGLVVCTSRHGETMGPQVIDKIERSGADLVTFVFGAPNRGVEALLRDVGLQIEDASDFVVNAIPDQGTETVRTEEAIVATLSVFNIALHQRA